jgi:nitrite reductase/ring-hydroxylating ferredoxin subunit
MEQTVALCNSTDLVNGGRAVPFDVVYAGQTCRAFAIRFEGQVHAYLNRCTHVAMEMDYQPDRFFDDTGRWLLCATHGAAYAPETGACAGILPGTSSHLNSDHARPFGSFAFTRGVVFPTRQ